ncbi:TetR/AcrR family transcriptional regulator [Saccharopolyspora spinosporotrichia]
MIGDFYAAVQKVRDRGYDFLNDSSRSRSLDHVARTGRPRGFDKDQTLTLALELFWSRGYGATSVQDLVDALAVERGSLYGTFGDKRRFYLNAVRLYWDVYERRLIAALDTAPLLPALREILTHPARLDEFISDVGEPHGCLVGNTTAELVPHDSEATEVVARSYRRFTDIVTDALRRAQATGEVTDNAHPEAQAQLLLYIVHGLSRIEGRPRQDRSPGRDRHRDRRVAGVTETIASRWVIDRGSTCGWPGPTTVIATAMPVSARTRRFKPNPSWRNECCADCWTIHLAGTPGDQLLSGDLPRTAFATPTGRCAPTHQPRQP